MAKNGRKKFSSPKGLFTDLICENPPPDFRIGLVQRYDTCINRVKTGAFCFDPEKGEPDGLVWDIGCVRDEPKLAALLGLQGPGEAYARLINKPRKLPEVVRRVLSVSGNAAPLLNVTPPWANGH